MGLTDAVFGYLQHRRFNKGAEVLGAAEALEQNGHPGVAARFYDRALEFFQGSAAPETFHQTVAARNRCQQRALDRGEDMSFAYSTSIEDISQDPARFIAWYYASQYKTLGERLQTAYNSQDWAGTVRLAEGGRHFLQFGEKEGAALAEYDCCYFGGAALFKMERFSQAHAQMERAYRLARSLDLHSAALAWTAGFLGLSAFHSGSRTIVCERALQEAAVRLQEQHGDAHAQAFSQHSVDALAELYGQQMSGEADAAIAAARRVLEWDDRYLISSTSTRAQDLLDANATIIKAAEAVQARRFDEAASALDAARAGVQKAHASGLTARLNETAEELRLSDPRNLPEHSRAVDALLAQDDFRPADQLYEQLRKRHADDPIVAGIRESMAAAKRAYVDRQIEQASQHVDRKEIAQADEALTNAMNIGSQVNHFPPAFAATQARLSQLKATQMGLEAQKLGKQREFKQARELVRQAGQLPHLPAGVAEKLAALDAALVRESETASTQCRGELQKLIQGEQWPAARQALDQAVQKGYDQSVAQEANLVRTYEQCQTKFQEALQAQAKHKLATARALLTEARAKTPSPAMKNQVADAQARLARLIDKVQRTHIKGDRSEVVFGMTLLAGLVLAGVLWWKSSVGFFGSLTVGLGSGLAFGGMVMCAMKMSLLAHDDGMHGLTWILAAGGAALGVLAMEWYWALGLGIVAGLIVHAILQGICPAIPGDTLEPKEDKKDDSPKDDSNKAGQPGSAQTRKGRTDKSRPRLP